MSTAAGKTKSRDNQVVNDVDNDKREKMRLKNARKHQRQKENRAQELHERCCQFLMSWKLEVLAQKLIVMGISHEHATYALTLNEGKLNESMDWVFDGNLANVADKKLVPPTFGNLKLDVTQELGRILELETKYKCSKQDVEKSVVAAQGDVEKAEESLRRQKQDQVPSVHTSQNSVAKLQPHSGMYNAGGEEEEEDRKNLGYVQSIQNIRDELKRLQQQEMREPVMVMHQKQTSQPAKTNVVPVLP